MLRKLKKFHGLHGYKGVSSKLRTSYTALLAGLNNGFGLGLVEVYDLGH